MSRAGTQADEKSRLHTGRESGDEAEKGTVLKSSMPPRNRRFGRVIGIIFVVLIISVASVLISSGSAFVISGLPFLAFSVVFQLVITLARCCRGKGREEENTAFMKRMQRMLGMIHPVFFSLWSAVILMAFFPYPPPHQSYARFELNTSILILTDFLLPFTHPNSPAGIVQLPYTVSALAISFVLLYFLVTFQVQIRASGDIGKRSIAYQSMVAMPAAFGFTSLFLSLFLLPFAALLSFASAPAASALLLLPLLLTVMGSFDTSIVRNEYVRISPNDVLKHFSGDAEKQVENKPQRVPKSLYKVDQKGFLESSADGVKVIQITDPHFSTFSSVERMQRLCKQVVERNPDIVLLTGDFYCVESHYEGCMEEAFAPLKALAGRTFACLGNHDKESPTVLKLTKIGLASLGVKLLVDEDAVVETRLGCVQVVGVDFAFPPAGGELAKKVSMSIPRRPDCILRITLLHDPSGFEDIPKDIDTVVFSGHTHGGQVGLVSLGIPFTMVGKFTGHPDFGLWSNGLNSLYVHRGQGFRTMGGQLLMRVGVPLEHSQVVIMPRHTRKE